MEQNRLYYEAMAPELQFSKNGSNLQPQVSQHVDNSIDNLRVC